MRTLFIFAPPASGVCRWSKLTTRAIIYKWFLNRTERTGKNWLLYLKNWLKARQHRHDWRLSFAIHWAAKMRPSPAAIKLCANLFGLSRDDNSISNSSIGALFKLLARQNKPRNVVFFICFICFTYVLVIINRQGSGRSSSPLLISNIRLNSNNSSWYLTEKEQNTLCRHSTPSARGVHHMYFYYTFFDRNNIKY